MALNVEQQRLLETAKSTTQDDLGFQQKLDDELAEIADRRQQIAKRFRQTLVDKAFAAAGIDPAEIAKRQDAENESLRSDLGRLRPLLDEESKRVHRRHLDEIERAKPQFLRKPAPGGAPVPYDVVALTTADAVDLIDNGTGTTASTAPWQNVLKTKLSTNPDFLNCSADFSFFWTPPRSGVLRAMSWIAANGSAEWYMGSNCWDGSYAGMWASGNLILYQFDQTGVLKSSFPASASVFGKYVSHGQTDYCLGDVGGASVDGLQGMDSVAVAGFSPNLPTGFPVLGNVEVLITVSVGAYVRVTNAACTLDLSSDNRQLTVLGVILNLY